MTLPPAVMRPTLQQGVFVGAGAAGAVDSLERFKLTFNQRRLAVTSGLANLTYTSSPPIGDYLFPRGDAIEQLAEPRRALYEAAA